MTEELKWKDLQEDLLEYGLRIPAGCKLICENLRNSKVEEAIVSIDNLIEGLNWIIRVKNLSSQEHINFPLDMERIINIWKEFNECLSDGSYEDAADILEYEFIEEFNGLNQN